MRFQGGGRGGVNGGEGGAVGVEGCVVPLGGEDAGQGGEGVGELGRGGVLSFSLWVFGCRFVVLLVFFVVMFVIWVGGRCVARARKGVSW